MDQPDDSQPESSQPQVDRARDLDRFLTFVDAVVAIAITLLVLPLVDVAGEVTSHSDVGAVLGEHTDEFVAFGISFLVIARLWFAQHAVLRPVVAASTRLSTLLMLWLATIVVLPFTTALVAQASTQPLVKGLYLGTMTLGSLLMAGLSAVVARDHSLRDGPASDPARSASVALVFAVCLLLIVLVPVLSYWPLLLQYAADPLARAWRRRRGPLPV